MKVTQLEGAGWFFVVAKQWYYNFCASHVMPFGPKVNQLPSTNTWIAQLNHEVLKVVKCAKNSVHLTEPKTSMKRQTEGGVYWKQKCTLVMGITALWREPDIARNLLLLTEKCITCFISQAAKLLLLKQHALCHHLRQIGLQESKLA